MRTIIITLTVLTLLMACRRQQPADTAADGTPLDTALQADTLAADSALTEAPKAADGLFDDFIYVFMRNPRFQLQRITFPLRVETAGKATQIERRDWKFNPLYARRDTYTLIFDSEAAAAAEKDTLISEATLEWVELQSRSVSQYVFSKKQGLWHLTRIAQHDIATDPNHLFLEFYRSFATSDRFQQQHISDPLRFKTYDADDFQNIEGVIDARQWPDFKPQLPHDIITNIRYGSHLPAAPSRQKVLMLCSQSGGMGCSLTFEQKGKSWQLTKLVN